VFGRLGRRVIRACTVKVGGDADGNIGHVREGSSVRDRRTNYQAGADFERKVRDQLMADGAVYVVRSAGSRGIADLVAFYEAEDAFRNARTFTSEGGEEEHYLTTTLTSPVIRLVQVKRTGKITDEDRELLTSLAAETGCSPWLAWPVKVGRRTVVEMEELSSNPNAEATEVGRA
jgi:Holliday junction resolvase